MATPEQAPPNDAMDTFIAGLEQARATIKEGATSTKFLADIVKKKEHQPRPPLDAEPEDSGEVIANLMLAYRHLEDASMRIGKAIQARNGGVSVYNRSTTVGA